MRNARFQELINDKKPPEQIVSEYQVHADSELKEYEAAETKPQKVKELIDYIIVNQPLIQHGDSGLSFGAIEDSSWALRQLREMGLSQRQIYKAMLAVEESNASKFIIADELDAVLDFFNSKGVAITIKSVVDNLYAAYSAEDQPNYPKGKLMKPHCYAPVDESKEFWL